MYAIAHKLATAAPRETNSRQYWLMGIELLDTDPNFDIPSLIDLLVMLVTLMLG